MPIRSKGHLLISMMLAGIFSLAAMPAIAQASGAGNAGLAVTTAPLDDLGLLRNQSFSSPTEFAHYHGAGNNDKPIQSRQSSAFARYNPVTLVLEGAMLGYQKLVSEQLARSCPYEISCSNFSKQCIEQFGIFKGIFISADRILRCNRIGILDISPVNINPLTGAIIDYPNMYR